MTGLNPSWEVRLAHAGPFRHAAFFSAVGEPSRMVLDDGSWHGSAAALRLADPPPRRPVPSTGPSASRSGSALASSSTWGGPRRLAAPAPSPEQQPPSQIPSSSPASVGVLRRGSSPMAASTSRAVSVLPAATSTPASASQSARGTRKSRATVPSSVSNHSALEERLDQVLAQLALLQQQNSTLIQELSHLRLENDHLRRQLQAAVGGSGVAPQHAVANTVPGLERPSAVRRRDEMEDSPVVIDGGRPGTPPGGSQPSQEPSASMESPAKLLERDAKRATAPLRLPSANE